MAIPYGPGRASASNTQDNSMKTLFYAAYVNAVNNLSISGHLSEP